MTSISWFVSAKCGSSEPWFGWKTMVSVSLLDLGAPAAAAGAAVAAGAAAAGLVAAGAAAGAVVGVGAAAGASVGGAVGGCAAPPHAATNSASGDRVAKRTDVLATGP